MTIAVIVDNGEPLLEKCIESLRDQTAKLYKDFYLMDFIPIPEVKEKVEWQPDIISAGAGFVAGVVAREVVKQTLKV